MIRDSWWQPLYTALRDDMPEDYYKIQDLFIENNGYRFHSFVLDEDFEGEGRARKTHGFRGPIQDALLQQGLL